MTVGAWSLRCLNQLRLLGPMGLALLLIACGGDQADPENRGPEARLRVAAQEITSTIERLPDLVTDLEATVADFATGGLRLHPDTLRALNNDGAGRNARLALWIAVAALILAAAVVI